MGAENVGQQSDAAPLIAETRLNLLTRLGWMVCSMPELLKNFVWDSFILFYYTQVLGLNGAWVGAALLVILTFDALVNPYIGALSDRLENTRLGRRHTLMACGITPFMIGIYAVFAPLEGLPQVGLFAWLLFFGLLARVGISFWSVPAYALGGDLSRHHLERGLIAILRNIGNQLTVLIVPIIAFTFYFVPDASYENAQLNRTIYPAFGLFAALFGGTVMLIGFWGTLSRARQVEVGDKTTPVRRDTVVVVIKRYLASFRLTPNVARVFFAALLVLITMSVVNQLTLHLVTYFWELSHGATRNLFMAQMVGGLLAMPVAALFMARVGRKPAMLAGLAGFFILLALAILLPLLSLAPAPKTAAMDYFIVGFRVASGFFYGLYVVPFSATTFDVGDEHRANVGGSQQQGLVGSLMITGIQLGSAVVGLVVGFFIAIIDFPVGLSVAEMPYGKVHSLALFTLCSIVIAGVVTGLVVGGFELSDDKQALIRQKLAALKNQ